MTSSRFARIAAVAIVAVLTLSGCSASSSSMKNNLIELELAELSGALNALPYVGIVSTFYNEDAEYEQQVRVVVSATTPTAEQTIVIAATANAALSRDVLTSVSSSFELKNAGTTMFRQSDFSITIDQLSSELRYAYALQEAFGAPLALGIDAGWEEDYGANPVDYVRWIDGSGSMPQPGDWDALRSVDDPNPSAAASWYFDGISVTGSLPPTEVTDTVYLLMATLPVFDGEVSVGYSWLSWDSNHQRLDVTVDSFDQPTTTPTQPFTLLPLWPRVVEAASLITDSGISSATLMVSSTVDGEYQTALVHFGPCANEQDPQERDVALAEALASSGVTLPSGSGPGYCGQF